MPGKSRSRTKRAPSASKVSWPSARKRWSTSSTRRVRWLVPRASVTGLPAGDRFAQRGELAGCGAERELDGLRPQVVAMDRIVDVNPDAAVQVLGGVDDAVAGLRRPEVGDPDLVARRDSRAEPPRARPAGDAYGFDVDPRFRRALLHRLEAADRPVKLPALRRVVRGDPQRPLDHAELERAQAEQRAIDHPLDDPQSRRRI